MSKVNGSFVVDFASATALGARVSLATRATCDTQVTQALRCNLFLLRSVNTSPDKLLLIQQLVEFWSDVIFLHGISRVGLLILANTLVCIWGRHWGAE